MGEVGPCGPCTEIYIDMGPTAPERWLEVWNIVFMQDQRIDANTTRPLGRVCVDTGMGLERIASVMQGVGSNYDIDLFQPIIRSAADIILSNVQSAATSSFSSSSSSRRSSAASSLLKPPSAASLDFLRDWSFTACQHLPLSASFTVLLDHIRAISFLYLHGLLPAPTSRGYVLRRLLRRSLTHAYSLGLQQPFLHRLYPAVREAMSGQYPELAKREHEITALIRQEEQLFYATMERGLHVLAEELKRVERKGGAKCISGDVAFQLYDAYGFPLDLTQMIAQREGWTVDEARFDALMAEQREGGRRGWVGSGEEAVSDDVRQWSSDGVSNQFSGYERMEQEVEVKAVGRAGEDGMHVVIDPCPFYATGGGQVSDGGWLRRKRATDEPQVMAVDDEQWEVLECTRVSDTLSVLRVATSSTSASDLSSSSSQPAPPSSTSFLQPGDRVIATVSPTRSNTAVHHTTTHLLHAALRQHLPTDSGRPVQQAGSLVTPAYFRFDFSYPSSIPHTTLAAIEHTVNQLAQQRLAVTASVMSKGEAETAGAVALFSDKYGEEVRVVRVGDASIELCGGTHARNSSECYPFVLLSEGSVSAGIRRIEGVSGMAAVEVLRAGWDGLRRMAGGGMKVNVGEVEKQYARLSADVEAQRASIKELNKRLVGKKGWPVLSGSLLSTPHVTVRLHLVPASDGGSLAAMRADAVALSSGSTGVDVLVCEESGLCMVLADGRRCGVSASEVWQRLMVGVRGAGGRGGGSGGMAQGKLPTDAAGRVQAGAVWAVLCQDTPKGVESGAAVRERTVMG